MCVTVLQKLLSINLKDVVSKHSHSFWQFWVTINLKQARKKPSCPLNSPKICSKSSRPTFQTPLFTSKLHRICMHKATKNRKYFPIHITFTHIFSKSAAHKGIVSKDIRSAQSDIQRTTPGRGGTYP